MKKLKHIFSSLLTLIYLNSLCIDTTVFQNQISAEDKEQINDSSTEALLTSSTIIQSNGFENQFPGDDSVNGNSKGNQKRRISRAKAKSPSITRNQTEKQSVKSEEKDFFDKFLEGFFVGSFTSFIVIKGYKVRKKDGRYSNGYKEVENSFKNRNVLLASFIIGLFIAFFNGCSK